MAVSGAQQPNESVHVDDGMPLAAAVDALKRARIRQALRSTGGNQTRAAKRLRLKRSSLQYKMKKYELSKPEGV